MDGNIIKTDVIKMSNFGKLLPVPVMWGAVYTFI